MENKPIQDSESQNEVQEETVINQEASDRHEMLPITKAFKYLLVRGGISLKELASRTGYSYSLLSAIQRGEKRLTKEVANAIMRAMDITEEEKDSLLKLTRRETSVIDMLPGMFVPVSCVMEKEVREDIARVLVLEPRPRELGDRDQREQVLSNLKRGAEYTYFLDSADVAFDVRSSLKSASSNPQEIDDRLAFVRVSDAYHPFIFIPQKRLWVTKQDEYFGAWEFTGPSGLLDNAVMMNRRESSNIGSHLHALLFEMHEGIVRAVDPRYNSFRLLEKEDAI